MTIEEFIENFDSIYVCHIKPNFRIQSLIHIDYEDCKPCYYGFTIKV